MTTYDFGPLVLGGNTFGWTSSKEESFAVLDAFVAAGGRAIDTADVYSSWAPGNAGGESETVLGEWLARRGRRDDVQIHTKVFALETRPGLSAANIRAAVDDSLRRLQTDHLDLYYAHRDDPDVAQEEYVAAFGELVAAGKVRAVGASNFTPERLRSAVAIAADLGVTGFTVSQDGYSLVRRDYETTLRDTVAELGSSSCRTARCRAGSSPASTGRASPSSRRAPATPRSCSTTRATSRCWTPSIGWRMLGARRSRPLRSPGCGSSPRSAHRSPRRARPSSCRSSWSRSTSS